MTQASKLSPDAFKASLKRLGLSQRRFAFYTGVNERTARRWADGEQDIPRWVCVMLELLEQLHGLGLWEAPPRGWSG